MTHKFSKLGRQFWTIIDEIARLEGMRTPHFLATLHDEVLERRGECENFASLLRVICAAWVERRGRLAVAAE